jgi:glycosyltransferase involved in cell wall biosynthesis
MKKLLHIIAQRPEKTGSGIYLQALLREADKKDYKQAFVAALNHGEEFIFNGENKIDFYPVFFHTEQLPFSIVGMSDIMPYESTKYSELTDEMLIKWKRAFREVITKAVAEFNPDIIISHHLWILTAYVKELFPYIKVFGVCHGTDLRQLKLAPGFSDYVIKGCAKLDLIFSLNEYQKDKIVEEYGVENGKVQVIGSGYNSFIFYRDECKKEVACIELVYAGKLIFSKGLLSLIKAVDKLNPIDKKIRLTIVGAGNQGEETEAIYNAARLCKHEVNFTGAVAQDKLAKIFRESDIFVLPSFYEGLPLVLIEALASGLKVVTTDLPGVKHWLGNKINSSGVIEYVKLPRMEKIDVPFKKELPEFENRLKSSIEHQIKRLLEHKNVLDDLGYESIKKLSWSGVFEVVENILKKSIEESKES